MNSTDTKTTHQNVPRGGDVEFVDMEGGVRFKYSTDTKAANQYVLGGGDVYTMAVTQQ